MTSNFHVEWIHTRCSVVLVALYHADAIVAAAESARGVGAPTTAAAIAAIAQTTTTAASRRGTWDTMSGDEVAVVAVHAIMVMSLLTAFELGWCCRACGP